MPRIPDEHLACVATLFAKNKYGVVSPIATAFLLEYREEMELARTVYLVTCVHCEDASKVVFSTGESMILERDKWTHDPAGNDVMAMDVTDLLPPEISRVGFPYLGNYVEQFERKYRTSDVGDEIYMLGLHTAELWAETLAPRARFGNISAWADVAAPVEQGNELKRPSHIGDMRSRPGFSGSPVFTYRESFDFNGSPRPTFFGVHSGQFHDQIKIRTHRRVINATALSSMTVIVPSWALGFIVEDDCFKEARLRRVS